LIPSLFLVHPDLPLMAGWLLLAGSIELCKYCLKQFRVQYVEFILIYIPPPFTFNCHRFIEDAMNLDNSLSTFIEDSMNLDTQKHGLNDS
jgi:hypothetical protein